MDYFGVSRGTIRSEAFKRLAKTTVSTITASLFQTTNLQENFSRLLSVTADSEPEYVVEDGQKEQTERNGYILGNQENEKNIQKSKNIASKTVLSTIAILPKEFEVLVALCEATSKIQSLPHAKILLDKFKLYLIELPNQKFSNAVVSKQDQDGIKSSPWLILAEKLVYGVINISLQFSAELMSESVSILLRFVDKLFYTTNELETDSSSNIYSMSHYLSLLGFIIALQKNPKILSSSHDGFKIFIKLDSNIDNPKFLNGVEISSNKIFSTLHDHDFAMEFSPILYIEGMSKLMCCIVGDIININLSSETLMEHLLKKVTTSIEKQEELEKEIENCDILILNGNGDEDEDEDEEGYSLQISPSHMQFIKELSDISIQKMSFLDRGETYIVYSTFSRLKIGYLAKAYNIQIIGCGMFTDNLDFKVAKKIFKNCLSIYDVMLDSNLGPSIIQLGALSVFKDDRISSSLTRSFTSLVGNPDFAREDCQKTSRAVGIALKVLKQSDVETNIYTLANLLSVESGDDLRSRRNISSSVPAAAAAAAAAVAAATSTANGMNTTSISHGAPIIPSSRGHLMSSNSSFDFRDNASSNDFEHANTTVFTNGTANGGGYSDQEYLHVCENAIIAISEIVEACDNEDITKITFSILSQKLSKLDSGITLILIQGLVNCAPYAQEKQFLILMRLLNRFTLETLEAENWEMFNGIINAKVQLSRKLKKQFFESENSESGLYYVYLRDLLSSIILRGDVQILEHHRSHVEINEVGEQIGAFLKPLSALLPNVDKDDESKLDLKDTVTINLFRNIWFNMVVHGYSIKSKIFEKYQDELRNIAYSSPPLASELSWDRTETSLELNTILRRGSSNHNVKDHKHIIGGIFDFPRTMSYPKLMFLSATILLESLRVKTSGDCSTILQYFSDPSIMTSNVDKYVKHIAFQIVKDYIFFIECGANKKFISDSIAEQLTKMLALCCHRVEELQDSAIQCCDLLINKVPSAICNSQSLFTAFDLLTVLFQSLVDADKSQYEPTAIYFTKTLGIKISLSDSYKWRNETFTRFHEKCKNWLKLALLKANDDVKSLIQSYVTDANSLQTSQNVQFGVSFALEMGSSILQNDRELSHISQLSTSKFNTLPVLLSQFSWRLKFLDNMSDKMGPFSKEYIESSFNRIRLKVSDLKEKIKERKHTNKEVIDLIGDCSSLILLSSSNNAELIRYFVEIPFDVFDKEVMNASIRTWFSIIKDRKNLSILIVLEILKRWEISIEKKQGLFSSSRDLVNPEFLLMEYSPSDKMSINYNSHIVSKELEPHISIIKLVSSNFETLINQGDHLLKMFTRFVYVGLAQLPQSGSLHPFARLGRFELIRFSFNVLNHHVKLGSRSVSFLTGLILKASLSWFKVRSTYPYGLNLLKIKADYFVLKEVARLVSHIDTCRSEKLELSKTLLLFFLDDEISKISVWLNPLDSSDTKGTYIGNQLSEVHIKRAYSINPILAINLALRYKIKNLDEMLQKLIAGNPLPSLPYPDAVQFFIGINVGTFMPSYHLLFWEPLSPIDAITLFLPPFGNNPYVLQYTMRSLETHDVNLTFFYVPQIVQSLRFDVKGYVERFILETAKVSNLFAHQIIWNMLANSYKDEDSTIADPLKPTLDKIQVAMIKSFSPQDLTFYEKEFGFFGAVTSISGKLKPYIKKTKAEKKVKIDEEMALIQVQSGVYLPSNPDGIVIDINRKSGKPLQSHAKAPFLATFKIKKEVDSYNSETGEVSRMQIEKWQSAIFKVGDDCRQDVLALQLISVFRTIWTNAGLDLYVFPYRVTATAPGCGVIDVLPNSVSRDMLGREAVNGLYEYFTTKFGPESSIEFQQARNNLIKSLAAYSIISYLLQFKDRHNGNIMYDELGHILHIDFGFCFDIAPGGVKFEMAPFKLTHEMILVLGGSSNTQAFKWFEELCVKGYLACRPYIETIVRCVNPMLESGLPCFKDTTIKKLRSRFVPLKSEKDAASHMKGLIKKSMEATSTSVYDEFQRITNGIPY